MNRCHWGEKPENMQFYHDTEWGKPTYDNREFFELLVLETFQAGLSWQTILNKREAFRTAFENFDIQKVKDFDDKKIEELMQNKEIIRNRLKINAAINNAGVISEMAESFSDYMWSFTENNVIINHYKNEDEIPAATELSERISKQMKKDGFKFVGPTIIYSFLQASGIINDHIDSCDFK